jgi:hypothetical protein
VIAETHTGRRMAKRKDHRRSAELFAALLARCPGERPAPSALPAPNAPTAPALPLMGKFRFQLLHQWLVETYQPCRVADIGGGKGLLAYLLQQSGWTASVVDPTPQPLPDKYRDLSGRRVRIADTELVDHLDCSFAAPLAQQFDLLVGLHAHGCNMQIIESAAASGAGFVLLPCCIIDEPVCPAPGVHWLECLMDEAIARGCAVRPFRLNFSGQNIGFHAYGARTNGVPVARHLLPQ